MAEEVQIVIRAEITVKVRKQSGAIFNYYKKQPANMLLYVLCVCKQSSASYTDTTNSPTIWRFLYSTHCLVLNCHRRQRHPTLRIQTHYLLSKILDACCIKPLRLIHYSMHFEFSNYVFEFTLRLTER